MRHAAINFVARALVTIVGGYALLVGFVALSGVTLPALGIAPSEVVLLSAMLGFVLYLGVLVWGFADRSLMRVSTILLGGAAGSIALAILLAPSSG